MSFSCCIPAWSCLSPRKQVISTYCLNKLLNIIMFMPLQIKLKFVTAFLIPCYLFWNKQNLRNHWETIFFLLLSRSNIEKFTKVFLSHSKYVNGKPEWNNLWKATQELMLTLTQLLLYCPKDLVHTGIQEVQNKLFK